MKQPRLMALVTSCTALVAGAAGEVPNPPSSSLVRERLSLDTGWRFHPGDIPFPLVRGHSETYNNAKAGRAGGAASPDYDDTEWRQLDLPHDWVVEGPFDRDANLSQGYRPRGFAWYRRHFKLTPADRGRHLELQFDGIATHATVWLNGTLVHRNDCGYTSFYIDITSLAKFGDELNSIAIRVDAEQQEGWWYEGGGIYRHTWLVKRSPAHVVTDGVFAQPVRAADGSWSVPVEVTLGNSGEASAALEVETVLFDPEDQPVARGATRATVPALGQAVAAFTIPVASPRLWSVTVPTLYRVVTTLRAGDTVVDEVLTSVGFRTLRFDANLGFFLNDQPLKIQGTCNHQDHAGVGVAVPDSIWDYRVRRLKAMGSNAYRCAHNPPAKEFLEACDRLGLLVMDENRLFNPTPEYLRQLEWLVRRDRNHPSVFLWSVFNEEPMQGTEQGYEMVRRMAALVKSLDTTRPVTAAMNGGLFAPKNVSQAVDVVGFNYQIGAYDRFHAAHPTVPLISSEDTSGLMQRGEYVTDRARNLIDAYDTQKPSWGATHREAWKAIAERPFLAGGFVWTGFDYRGEPTPYQWPSAGSFFGCMDQCGFPKTAFYLHEAQWVSDRAVLHLVPHWNWPGREGQPIHVLLAGNAESAELFLNGTSLGAKPIDRYEMAAWDVPYAPGKLEAVAQKNGREVSRTAVETTGAPVSFRLTPDRPTLAGDGRDAVPITVEALDEQGRVVPTTNLGVDFELSGPGAVIGLANGDPNSHEPEQGLRRQLYNGLAQIILQSRAGGSGPLLLRAKSEGLATAEIRLLVNATAPVPAVPPADPVVAVARWKMSPVTTTKPDANQRVAENDQNSWVNVQAGSTQKFTDGAWAIYRATFKPFAAQRARGGVLRFREITGRADVWLDDQLVATKTDSRAAPLIVPLPPSATEHTVNVVIEGAIGKAAGLSGLVSVEPAGPAPTPRLSAAPTMTYQNPIVSGFYPDPSVCRVGEDYYLVNSSFEYFPGVPVFHSRDLAHWQQIGHVLTRPGQLPLANAKPSDGIYAPTIRHHAGKFYMATTNNIVGQGFKNFFVTADNPAGPWSDPIWVAQGGIDPSLFFDDDGKVYWTGNGTGWAPVRGIYQSEIDAATGKLLSEIKFLWAGSGGSYPESPHLFKRGGYYYLSVAEGGTAECHMVTIARARAPFGPFEPCPHNPVLTHRSLMSPISATGHADFFEDHQGNWWAVFLGIRYANQFYHNLGRETFLAPVTWTDDGWPVVNGGEKITQQMSTPRALAPQPWPADAVRDDFTGETLALPWVFLRNPSGADWSLTARPGWLRLRCAAATLDDLASPAFVGRRQRHFDSRSATLIDFQPRAENEEAGLTALLDDAHHAELIVTQRGGQRVAFVRRHVGTMLSETPPVPMPAAGALELTLTTDRKFYRFSVAAPGLPPQEIGCHEMRFLSTEVAGGYTGVMIGLFATARGKPCDNAAHFDSFDYEPLTSSAKN